MLNSVQETKLIALLKTLLDQDQIDVMLQYQQEQHTSIPETVTILKLLSEAVLYQNISEVIGYPYIYLSDQECVRILKQSYGIEHHCVVLQYNQTTCLAMADPFNIVLKDEVQQCLGCALDVYLASPLNIHDYIYRQYPLSKKETSLTDSMVLEAVLMKASDIHLQPEANVVVVKFRMDGILRKHKTIILSEWPKLLIKLKLMGNLDIAESRRPQSGRFSQTIAGRAVDFRISTHPTVRGENIVIRILEKNKTVMSLRDLGFDAQEESALTQQVQTTSGLVIVCGPTGSGKTTTLYSLLQIINDGYKNIMTLEDPVEYQLQGIRQTELIHKDILDYDGGIKSLLRQDPDIIFISEIRDESTAKMAIRASITGHLIFATLHTFDTISVIYRLVELNISPKLLASSLKAIIAQRLVRRVCLLCHGKGCTACFHEGLKDRVAISEILAIDDTIRNWIASSLDYQELVPYLQAQSFQTLQISGQIKAEQGITTSQEILRVLG